MNATVTSIAPTRVRPPVSLRRDFLRAGRERLKRLDEVTWPSPRWRDDPVGFAHEVLGIELWSAQVEIVESIRDHRNTTVRSGHKCGKSTALAVAALWFFASFDRARVVMTAVKASQVDEVIWKEVRRLYRGAKIPLGGDINFLARSGLRDRETDRQVWGMTASHGEGLAGISGPSILVLADEASGIDDAFFEVLGSSLAGDGGDGLARKCYISNPTKTTGEFYRSHTTLKELFHCLHVSSETTPNAMGTGSIPGLAGRAWIEEKKLEYGEESAQYRIRVKGEFVADAEGKILSLNDLTASQERWDETADNEGDLQIGVDPAGEGEFGDETVIAVRRGRKIVTLLPYRAQTEDAIVEHVIATYFNFRTPTVPGKARIAVDAEGGIGSRIVAKLAVRCEAAHVYADVVEVRSGKKLYGSPEFRLIRDSLWGQAKEWVRSGGALPEDAKLAQELNAAAFVRDDKTGWLDATPKKELRKILGRSPDRADAVCLAIYGFKSVGNASDELPPPERPRMLDPYDGGGDLDVSPDRVFDPYGGGMS